MPDPSAADDTATRGRLLWASAAGIVAAVLLIAVHVAVPVQTDMWYRVFFDTLHVPVFALVALCLLIIVSGFGSLAPGTRFALAALGVLVLSVLSEAAQIPGVRDASLDDLVADWLGGVSALLLAAAATVQLRRWRRIALVIAGVAVLAVGLGPLLTISAAYAERNLQVPVLLSFESRLNHLFVRAQNARLSYTHSGQRGATAARVVLGDGAWPGLIIHDIWPDWSGYDALIVNLSTPDDTPFELNLRVHDSEHRLREQAYSDRFNTRFEINPDTRSVRIPLARIAAAPATRKMDMRAIHGIVIFGTADQAGHEFHLESLRLE